EGLAVLAEPATEQRHRQADLREPLEAGRTFKVGPLMTMDYPDPRDWRLFYAQSVSLTLFLVEQGPPERFIQFVRDSQRIGAEAALRDVYHIEGLAALQERWLDYARKRDVVDLASSRDAEATPGAIDRDRSVRGLRSDQSGLAHRVRPPPCDIPRRSGGRPRHTAGSGRSGVSRIPRRTCRKSRHRPGTDRRSPDPTGS